MDNEVWISNGQEKIENKDSSHCIIKHHCFDDCWVVGFLRENVQ